MRVLWDPFSIDTPIRETSLTVFFALTSELSRDT